MKIFTVLKHYFSHYSIWIYIAIASILGYISIKNNYFEDHWYSFIIIILVAPFFEWFVHKYVLHKQIGNVFEIENTHKNIKVGDEIDMIIDNEQKKCEVMSIKGEKIQLGYGLAKNKFIRNYMNRLHIGHHKNPEIVHLIFAQPSAAFLIFIEFFVLSYLFTFNIGFAVVFTFYTTLYYLHYEWMHLAHHIVGYKHLFPWSNKLKRAHLLHHYSNENYWWGITNNVGDLFLKTFPEKNDVEFSKTVHNINHFPELKENI